MWLLAGLGNPGQEHAGQRHNIGFMAVDEIHRHFGFPAWKKKFHSELSETALPGIEEKILLLKPQTYMNKSGAAVQAASAFYKIPLSRMVIFHDELDLAPGKVKVKQGGSPAGHNGLKSLDECIGQDYTRVRLGIGHPGVHEANKAELVLAHALSDFSKADKNWLGDLLEAQAKALPLLLNKGAAEYLNTLALAGKE